MRRGLNTLAAQAEKVLAEAPYSEHWFSKRLEKGARGKPPEDRAAIRQAKAKPVFDDLEGWLAAQLLNISGKSPLARAIRYALGRLPKAPAYPSNGHLEADNNAAEPVVIGRKN